MTQQIFPHLANRRVFVTGHTGFKGSWLIKWLSRLGAVVRGYALPPYTTPNHFEVGHIEKDLESNVYGDLRDYGRLSQSIQDFQPDLIMHLAAQSVVSRGYDDPLETFSVNVMGTANVLESVRHLNRPTAVLCVTSDKCYENVEQVWGYRETDSLGEKDPYGGSKGAAELVIRSYRHSFFPTDQLKAHNVYLASARAGNVIGGGDWTPNALMVDVFKSLCKQQTIELRSPSATRPWQHVLQCLSGYLEIADQLLAKNSVACDSWNIGPLPGNEWSVQEVVEKYIEFWGAGNWNCPEDANRMKESSILRLAIDKALWQLNWRPLWDVETSIGKTVEWFKAYLSDEETINETTSNQIREYEDLLYQRKVASLGQPVH